MKPATPAMCASVCFIPPTSPQKIQCFQRRQKWHWLQQKAVLWHPGSIHRPSTIAEVPLTTTSSQQTQSQDSWVCHEEHQGWPGRPWESWGNHGGSIPICEPWCWNIYLQNWAILGVNVGKYTIHGAYGIYKSLPKNVMMQTKRGYLAVVNVLSRRKTHRSACKMAEKLLQALQQPQVPTHKTSSYQVPIFNR